MFLIFSNYYLTLMKRKCFFFYFSRNCNQIISILSQSIVLLFSRWRQLILGLETQGGTRCIRNLVFEFNYFFAGFSLLYWNLLQWFSFCWSAYFVGIIWQKTGATITFLILTKKSTSSKCAKRHTEVETDIDYFISIEINCQIQFESSAWWWL